MKQVRAWQPSVPHIPGGPPTYRWHHSDASTLPSILPWGCILTPLQTQWGAGLESLGVNWERCGGFGDSAAGLSIP